MYSPGALCGPLIHINLYMKLWMYLEFSYSQVVLYTQSW